MDREAAPSGGQGSMRGGSHQGLVPPAVANDVGHADDRQPEASCNSFQVPAPGHGAVIVHDLADGACGGNAANAAQIHRGLGVPAALEDPAPARDERKYVPWPRQAFRPARFIRQAPQRGGAIRGGNARRGAVDPVDALGESRAVQRSPFLVDLDMEIQALRGRRIDCAADQAAGLPRHQVDVIRGGMDRRHHEVPLAFAVGGVGDDDHASRAQLFDRVLDRIDGRHDGSGRRAFSRL